MCIVHLGVEPSAVILAGDSKSQELVETLKQDRSIPSLTTQDYLNSRHNAEKYSVFAYSALDVHPVHNVMLRCIEHNSLLRHTNKTEGLGACRQLRHEYSIIAASYNAGPAEDKFAGWDNSSGDYHLTHLDNPTPTTRKLKLKVNMPILFIPKTFQIAGYVIFPEREYDDS
ncbi:hypothetical protein EDD85DRAFT_792871 [Armillaria nabsnona]|nr:hypothetical protein EDD85DRAFT_792871 [Armillaria nabsnona]